MAPRHAVAPPAPTLRIAATWEPGSGRVSNRPDEILGLVQKRGLTSEPTLDYDPENGFRRGACPRF